MNYLDNIYIINLEYQHIKKRKCILQLKKYNVTNYTFFSAINTCNNSYIYDKMYENIIKNMAPEFIKNNFTKGALGCILSHIECLKDAKKNGYKSILVLEDDFIMINNFDEKMSNFMINVDDNWDFLYLGKKQGKDNDIIDININIHNNEKFNKIQECNDFYYKPNYKTWATHALLIKDTMFDDIINFEKNIIAPIDLMLMTLYDKYNFYCVKEDLFITYEETTIQSICKKNIWDWNLSLYNKLDTFIVENIIIIGFKDSDHTHKYIHEMYFHFFNYYYPYLNIYWFNNNDIIDEKIINNSIVFCSPCHCIYNNIPKQNNIFYILHLDEFNDNIGYKSINDYFQDKSNSIIKESNNYIVLTCRENIHDLKYFEKNIENKTICLPWFSNDLYEKIIYNYNNLDNIYEKCVSKKYLCYMGSIWHVNIDIIKKLIDVCEMNSIHLLLKGRIFSLTTEDRNYIKQINTHKKYTIFVPFLYKEYGNLYENSFAYIDESYGINGLLPFQGNEHNNSYISNRIFETISRGYLIITNNALTKKYFTTAIYNENIIELILTYYTILLNKDLWISTMKKQINEYIEKFYGYNNINNIFNFLKETTLTNNKLLTFNNESKEKYNIWFVNNTSYTNTYYSIIETNEDIRKAMINKNNYIIYPNEYDIFLIEQIISFSNYSISLDENIENKQLIIDICNKYNKNYTLKRPLNIVCLLSGQRTGSTLLIDYLQKKIINTLALSEIFNYYNNSLTYPSSYDCIKGILKNIKINNIDNCKNMNEYFKQFEDFANLNNYENLVFKLTLDFNINSNHFTKLDTILDFIKDFNIIYLERNDMECYISKKLAEKNDYANTIYNNISDNFLKIKEFYTFINNKEKYIKLCIPLIRKSYMLNYNDIISTPLDIIYKNIFEHFKIPYNIEINNSIPLNIKQNTKSYDYFLDLKYWE